MFANVVKTVFALGLILNLISCAKSEDELLLEAVKKYGVPGGTLEYVINERGKALGKKEGQQVVSEWHKEPLAEDKFKIQAQIGFVGMNTPKQIYEWVATKNHERSEEGVESVYKLEPQNKEARTLNNSVRN